MDSRVELQGDDISGLLAVWARRHAVRTLLGGAAYLALLAGI
jgi:hypothetical protein